MKTLKLYAFLGTVVAAMIFAGCSKNDDLDQSFYDASSKHPSESLSGQELQGLLYMAEKQKLHRDVYMAMDERTANPIFNELYLSAAKNMDLITATIENFGQVCPVSKKGVGDFIHAEVQNVYDEFTNSVNDNLIDLLSFALRMEERTVEDIQDFLEQEEGNADIRQLYTELLTDSYSHLDVLNKEIKRIRKGIVQIPVVDER